MIKTNLILLPFFLLMWTFSGCTRQWEDDQLEIKKVAALNIQIPQEMSVGNDYTIHFDYPLSDGCTEFFKVDVVSTNTFTKHITVFVKKQTGQNCIQVYSEVGMDIGFSPGKSGTYHFLFWKGEDERGNDLWDDYYFDVSD